MTDVRERSGRGPKRPGPRVTPAVMYRRRRIAVAALAVVVLLLVLGFAGLVWPGFLHAREPEPVPTVTVTAPAPKPTIKAMKRSDDETAFQEALPSAVLQFALTEMGGTEAAADHGATEGWLATYSDGGSKKIKVEAAQWASSDESRPAAEALAKDAGEAERTGDVKVGKDVVGGYTLTAAADGRRTITWRNGTAVFRATGPADAIVAFYQAFPL
ncbi:hypothetical protein [Myceligenerans crystallogenes]|uniref:Secreted protein n=1 Tax=Myceligenerans crystallogenes TaxID=316335 RepID=A0ABN2N2F9_9MICO